MMSIRRGLVEVVALLLASGLVSPLLAQQAAPSRSTQSPGGARLSPEQVLRLSLTWVDFLAVLADVRALETTNTDIGQMLINNRISVNKLKSPLLLGRILGEPPYPKGSLEQRLIEALRDFGEEKVAQSDKGFALLRRVSEATSAADIKTLPGDVAVFAGEVDALWKRLPLFAVLLSHILVDDTRVVDDRMPYLKLTSQQIATLKLQLRHVFPDVGTTKGGFALEVSASLLYGFLDSGYRAADDTRLK